MSPTIYVEDQIVFDTREKIVVNSKLYTDVLEEISAIYLIVKYEIIDNNIYFYLNTYEKSNYEKDIAYLPSNVKIFIGKDMDIQAVVGGKLLEIEGLNSDQLLKNLYKLKYDDTNLSILEIKKDNYEVRRLLENTKNVLQELSSFVNSASISLHKKDLVFEVDENSDSLRLEGGNGMLQILPVSSLSISAIRLFCKKDSEYYYTATDILQIQLLTIEGDVVIALWEIPLSTIHNEVLVELLSPYIGAKESMVIIIRNLSQTPIVFDTTKEVRNKKWLPRDVLSRSELSSNPIALEIYKSYHTSNITYSPYLKKSDTIFSEFDSSFLSRNIFKNYEIYLNFLDSATDENTLATFVNDTFRMTSKDLMEVCLPHALGTEVSGITARYHAVEGEGKIGMLVLPAGKIRTLVDRKSLAGFEDEGLFSGWKNTSNEASALHLFLPVPTEHQYHLYLLVQANEKGKDYVIEWTNIEIFNEQI